MLFYCNRSFNTKVNIWPFNDDLIIAKRKVRVYFVQIKFFVIKNLYNEVVLKNKYNLKGEIIDLRLRNRAIFNKAHQKMSTLYSVMEQLSHILLIVSARITNRCWTTCLNCCPHSDTDCIFLCEKSLNIFCFPLYYCKN